METIERLLAEHDFFRGIDPRYFPLLVGCATNARFDAGAFLFREGGVADRFYLVRRGRAAVEISAPERGGIVVETVGPGEVIGFSWLVPPYRWRFDVRVLEPMTAVTLDGACLRGKCEEDHELGYQLVRRFAGVALERLQATRMQLLDVYGHAHAH
jgi:CRP/FNR family cyclic AMP-dependent transcriptional regulator